MRVLIVKMTSMGDVIHTLPALTDAKNQIKGITFDWVVEKAFAQIPSWHPAVSDIIPCNLRQWRKTPFQAIRSGEIVQFFRALRKKHYDLILDPQGLLKSAIIAKIAKGNSSGYATNCIREKLASSLYDTTFSVPWGSHALTRVRELFARALQYPLQDTPPDYGIDRSRLAKCDRGENYCVFLHGTTWPTKHWPEEYWQELATLVSKKGYNILLPWGNALEQKRAMNIAARSTDPCKLKVLPKLSLGEMASVLIKAKGVVAVDTGLSHVAAAMGVPTVSLYGSTNPGLTGAFGPGQVHLSAVYDCAPCFERACQFKETKSMPCYKTLPPQKVFEALLQIMEAWLR